jgi:hypothetical protein
MHILTISVPGMDSGSLKSVVLQSAQKLLVILLPESATPLSRPDLKLLLGIIQLLLKRPPQIFYSQGGGTRCGQLVLQCKILRSRIRLSKYYYIDISGCV